MHKFKLILIFFVAISGMSARAVDQSSGLKVSADTAKKGKKVANPRKLAETNWRYVRPITPETTLLNVRDPIDIQLCLSNKGIAVNFQITTQQCGAQPETTQTVSGSGCASFGSVRRVSILQKHNPNAFAAGGVFKHVDFDEDLTLPPVDRSKMYPWTYTVGNRSDIYKDPQKAARILRLCVAKGAPANGWGVNFKMKGNPCSGDATDSFTVTGVTNEKYGIVSACAIVQATEVWIDGADNPGGSSKGTYQFLK